MNTNNAEFHETGTSTAIPESGVHQMTEISIEQLVPFKQHVFKPYGDQRMKTLVASVQENGIIHAVIVRRAKGRDDLKYEIISGHNRVEAAKQAKMEKVPVVIKELSDDEAVILANEANIESRSFQTWLPSEKINSIRQYHAAVRSQGRAKDSKSASGDKRQKSEDSYARQRTAQVYGISPSQVRAFIELSRLTVSMQNRLDAEDFGTTPASEISFISAEGQELINSVLNEDAEKKLYRVTVKRSEALRDFFENEGDESRIAEDAEAVKDGVRRILNVHQDTPSETATEELVKIPITREQYEELFQKDTDPEDIADYVVQCVRHCTEHKLIQR